MHRSFHWEDNSRTGAVPLGSFVDLALGQVVRKNGIWPALVLVLHDVVGGLDA